MSRVRGVESAICQSWKRLCLFAVFFPGHHTQTLSESTEFGRSRRRNKNILLRFNGSQSASCCTNYEWAWELTHCVCVCVCVCVWSALTSSLRHCCRYCSLDRRISSSSLWMLTQCACAEPSQLVFCYDAGETTLTVCLLFCAHHW